MINYFTIGDFILFISIALIGALFFNAIPVASGFRRYLLRVLGAALGVALALMVVEGLPALL